MILSAAKELRRKTFSFVWSFCVVCKCGEPAFEKELRLFEKHRGTSVVKVFGLQMRSTEEE